MQAQIFINKLCPFTTADSRKLGQRENKMPLPFPASHMPFDPGQCQRSAWLDSWQGAHTTEGAHWRKTPGSCPPLHCQLLVTCCGPEGTSKETTVARRKGATVCLFISPVLQPTVMQRTSNASKQQQEDPWASENLEPALFLFFIHSTYSPPLPPQRSPGQQRHKIWKHFKKLYEKQFKIFSPPMVSGLPETASFSCSSKCPIHLLLRVERRKYNFQLSSMNLDCF